MKTFLDCFKEIGYFMMCFAMLWLLGILFFPSHKGVWSFIMVTVLGVSFFGAILLGAQYEQERIWNKQELEAASKIIKSEDRKVGVTIDGQYQIVDLDNYKLKG